MNKGVVLLTGTAKTLSAHLRAVEVVAGMPGVQRVASEVQSPDTLADAEIWRKPASQPSTSKGYGVGEAASDMWITSATKMRLLADPRTPALDINVDTRAGIVTLFGIVPTQDAKAAAGDARKVSGVTRVVNELQVVASAKQAAVKVRDEELEGVVKKAFDAQDFKDVTVTVKNGVVRLPGPSPPGRGGWKRRCSGAQSRACARSRTLCASRRPRAATMWHRAQTPHETTARAVVSAREGEQPLALEGVGAGCYREREGAKCCDGFVEFW